MIKSILLIFVIFIVNVYGYYILKQVQIVYRHGDRSPISIFPNDVNKVSKWKDGLGQLTDIGIHQHFNLGIWLRKRYRKFFGSALTNTDIYVKSGDLDRTLMSAEADIAGLIMNNTVKVIPQLPWRPVAIHTKSKKLDYLLELEACPRYQILKEQQFKSKYFRNKLAKYQSILLYLQQKTGISNLSFMNSWFIYDTLFCERIHNMTPNIWVTEELWKNLTMINRINWEIMVYDNLAKLAGGFLLYTLTNNMKQMSNKTWSHKESKVIMFSGHDTNVAALAKLLGFYKNIQPPYASSIIFELYHNSRTPDPWAVKVFYKNVSESNDSMDLLPYLIPGCSSVLCPLSEFLKSTKDKCLSKKALIKKCDLNILRPFNFLWILVFLSICICIFAVVMCCIVCLRKRDLNYSRIEKEEVIN